MEENNKIIAEFMGFTFEKNIGYYDNEMLLEQIVYEQQNGNCFDELLFDKSWDWLMVVVKKILKDFYKLNPCPIYLKMNIEKVLNEVNIDATYNSCVEFIKWYNQNKEKAN